MSEEIKAIGNAIKSLRKEAKWTQADIAKRSGVSRTHIAAFERGKGNPTMQTLQRIFAVFGLSMSIRVKPNNK
jgi:putative transcriptional regulator